MSEPTSTAVSASPATTFPQLLRSAAHTYGEAVAVTLEDAGTVLEHLTYAQLEHRSQRLARSLIAQGAGKGSRIGFIMGNGPEFAVALAAISRLGAIAIPISTMIKSNELVRVLRQSDIQGLIVQRRFLGKDYAERLLDALPDLIDQTAEQLRLPAAPYLRWIAASGNDLPSAFTHIDTLLAKAESVSDALLLEIESEVHSTDQMIEIYTSGSMALPKGVRHAHGPICFRSQTMIDMIGYIQGQRVPCMLPMFWIGGLMMYLIPGLQAGATVVCTDRTLSNSRFAMGSVLAEEDLALIKGPKPWWGLGMSETLGPYSWGDDFRAPGRPVCAPMDHFAPGYDIRIATPENTPVNDGEIGEMQVRGYPVTNGLHKIERSQHFTDDGYYRTGDLCLVEERPQGRRIHFVGRDGDMIKVASSNVSPAEVEMELQAFPGVHSAYVVGLPDPQRGAKLVAALVPRDGATLDFAEIESRLHATLSSYKVPRIFILLERTEIPLLHSNKVSRKELTKTIECKIRSMTQ